MSIPTLALGTWLMGGMKDPDPENDDARDIAVIHTALENGITLIDTAQNYAAGRCEEIVAQALVGKPRDNYQLLTKQGQRRLDYDSVVEDCHASLERLQVDYLDYFVCHAPNADFDMRDFFRASNKLYADGLIKHVGVSNFGPNMLRLAMETSDMPIVLNQVHVSLTDDDVFSTETYDFCVENDIAIQSYRPLAWLPKNPDAMAALSQIASSYNLTPEQIAISYLHSFEGMAFTVRSSSTKHWEEIKQALDVQLTDQEIGQLRATHQNRYGKFHHYLVL